MRPALSVREDTVSSMAGAIFMSNTVTREQCFQAGVFGLPIEYESFVYNVRKGMPLFLFDYNLRKLYGVFEAASNGGLNIIRDAFQHAYPAQVRVSIIWKCRPLSEDEFSPAIEENYYLPKKFYFDLSFKQVVRLYELFDDKRVELPIHNYAKNESFGTQDLNKRAQGKRSWTPNALHSDDQSDHLIPDISTIVKRYSSHTSKHTVLAPRAELQPNTMLPMGMENFGPQTAFMHKLHDQTEFPCQSEHLQAVSVSTKNYQLAGSQSYPSYQDYPQKALSSGRIIQSPIAGAKSVGDQSYSLSRHFAHNSISSGYLTQNSTYGKPAPYALPILQDNADYQEHCDICIRERHLSARDEMYAYEHQRLSEGKALPSAELSQQGIPAYPDVPEFGGKAVLAVDQQKNGPADYISLSDCGNNIGNAPDSSDTENDMGVDMSSQQHIKHVIGAESNTTVPQSSVFSRIALSKQPSQAAMGPTLNQLVSSLSQKAKEWSDENGPVLNVFSCMIREQAADRPYLHSQLNLSSQIELEAEAGESTESQPPFLNFKRRSEARNVDTNLGKEAIGKVKRRKLVRPSFGENNASTCSGNCIHERKKNYVKVGGNHFDIDLNTPATVDSDPIEKDDRIEVCPGVLIKTQTEKLCEVDADKTKGTNVMGTIKEQVPSFYNGAPAKRVSFDINISELNTMDESKLRTILDQTSSLLHAIGKIASVKSANFEESRSSSMHGEL
ncbi:hypothetical protein QOZ80_6BG0479590 [Eleusine coracana subsp. coracana]|nr:hypothetical protein QOZ80_6BG0479590 [Eleusine coracana subsp. coracana]